MKKILSLVMVLTLVVFAFTANIQLANGTYRAEAKEASHGWIDYVELTVNNGKITDAVMNSYNAEDGSLKTNDESYAENMGMDPNQYFGDLAKDLEKKQNIEDVDTVTGATHSSHNFKALVHAIMDRGVAGSTILVDISRYELADGKYRAEAKEASHGWTDFVEITVENGEIVKAVADSYDANGNLKTNDEEYAKNMGYEPKEYFGYLADQLENHKTPSDIDTFTGATHSSENVRLLSWALMYNGKPGETLKVDLSSFVAANLPDGNYRAEYAEASHGWTEYLEITVKNGLIVKAYSDAFDANGNLKTDDPNYAKNMGYDPVRYYGFLAQEIIAGQSVEEVDTFTGATHSSEDVRVLLQAIIDNGTPGKTVTVK